LLNVEQNMPNMSNIRNFISFIAESFITITITINNTDAKVVFILDVLKAASMQISIWRWEWHMIRKYGFDWGYKEFR
jgi:hypothetical protein